MSEAFGSAIKTWSTHVSLSYTSVYASHSRARAPGQCEKGANEWDYANFSHLPLASQSSSGSSLSLSVPESCAASSCDTIPSPLCSSRHDRRSELHRRPSGCVGEDSAFRAALAFHTSARRWWGTAVNKTEWFREKLIMEMRKADEQLYDIGAQLQKSTHLRQLPACLGKVYPMGKDNWLII